MTTEDPRNPHLGLTEEHPFDKLAKGLASATISRGRAVT